MDTTLLAMEKENKRKGMRNSIILHLLLLLIAWFYMFPAKVPDVPVIEVAIQFEESKLIDFAMSSDNSRKSKAAEGKTRAKTEEVKQVKSTPAEVKVETKVTPPTPAPPTPVKDVTPTEPIVSEVLEEESPVEAIEEEMEFDEPEEEVIPEPVVEEADVEETNPTPPAEETGASSKNNSNSKTGTDKPSSIDGDGGPGKGDSGDGDGRDSGGDDGDSGIGDGGAGNGEFDGSGDGVFGRKVIYRNHAELAQVTASGSGKIYVKVCINRGGLATYTEIDNFNTTITNKNTLRKALKMIKGYKFEPDRSAPKEQCGMIKLFLDINAFK